MQIVRFWVLVTIAFSFLLPAAASSQAERKLSAREIFYSAPTPPAAAKKTEAPKPPPARAAPQRARPEAEKPPQPVASTQIDRPVAPPKPPVSVPDEKEAEAKLVPAALTPERLVPLGLRYSILQRLEGAETIEVDPDAVFRAGDRIRLRVQVNDTGYLYIIHQGSSGIWRPLFPSAEIQGGDNRVEKGRSYDIPSGYVFTFDEQPGIEKLFIVLSRQPEADLEGLIYTLSGRETSAPKPAKPEPGAKILIAQNLAPIDDGLVSRLRNAYARDLIIEKVDEQAPGPKKEKAVYAVNTSRAHESRVVVDVRLNHR